jgi:hypothetical protein
MERLATVPVDFPSGGSVDPWKFIRCFRLDVKDLSQTVRSADPTEAHLIGPANWGQTILRSAVGGNPPAVAAGPTHEQGSPGESVEQGNFPFGTAIVSTLLAAEKHQQGPPEKIFFRAGCRANKSRKIATGKSVGKKKFAAGTGWKTCLLHHIDVD